MNKKIEKNLTISVPEDILKDFEKSCKKRRISSEEYLKYWTIQSINSHISSSESVIKEEFDKNGNSVHEVSNKGFILNHEYDDQNRPIYYEHIYRDSHSESWYRYDENNKKVCYKEISHRSDPRRSSISEYDEKGNLTYIQHSNGVQRWYRYSAAGTQIVTKEIIWDWIDKKERESVL